MISALLMLLVAAQPAPEHPWAGSVTGTMGAVVLERDGHQYNAHPGAGLRIGDRIQTLDQAGASLYLYGDQVIYLAGDTLVQLQQAGRSGLITLALIDGEARATVGKRQPLRVATSLVQAEISQAIVRLSNDRSGTRLGAELGELRVTSRDRQPQVVRQGDDLRVTAREGQFPPVKSTGQHWTIHPADYQRVAAAGQHHGHGHGHGGQPPGRCYCCPPVYPGQQPGEQQPTEDQQATDDQQPDQQQPEQQPSEQPSEQQASDDASGDASSEANSQYAATSGSSLGLGSLASSSFASGNSGGLFADANQQTLQGMLMNDFNNGGTLLPSGSPFPGNIHIVTGETRYSFGELMLTQPEMNNIFIGGMPAYWSIGVGTPPTSQVTTDFATGTNATPTVIPVPQFDAYLIRLDQFGTVDAALDPAAAEASNAGITGLLGNDPTAPTINGATPLEDTRSPNQINERATFALGEFRLRPDGSGLELAIRSSDQDRRIIKDQNGNDALDMVKPNRDVTFRETVDPRFLPAAPTVQVPARNDGFRRRETTFSNLDVTRRAAATTLMADQLHDFARRTGQTRFVLTEQDGRQRIIDITGYRRPQP